MMTRALVLICALAIPALVQAEIVTPGQDAPAVALPRLPETGKTLALADFRGKVVYLDFWASWCGPCRISFPILDEIRQETAERGFEVLAVNVDEFQEDALGFLEDHPVNYPILWDPEGRTPEAYGIIGMPTGFLIDREGTVREVHQGFRKSDGPGLRASILKLLAESP